MITITFTHRGCNVTIKADRLDEYAWLEKRIERAREAIDKTTKPDDRTDYQKHMDGEKK